MAADRYYLLTLTPKTGDRRRTWCSIGLLLLPLIGIWCWEVGTRCVTTQPRRLLVPWKTADGPYRPNEKLIEKHGWGDLLRMAGLPLYESLVGHVDPRVVRTLTDSAGFRNTPASGEPDTSISKHDITVLGASFMTIGTDNKSTFAVQLGEATSKSVYNMAWPGQGPAHAAIHFIERFAGQTPPSKLVVMGIVQRALLGSLFRNLAARLDSNGQIVPYSKGRLIRQAGLRWLRWNQRLEDYLNRTSSTRELAASLSEFLPPMALDLGLGVPVKLAYLDHGSRKATLVYEPVIASSTMDYSSRGGALVCDAIHGFHRYLESRQVRLVVCLIPDKYEVWQRNLNPVNFSKPTPRLKEPVTATFQRQLQELGVEVLDLEPFIRKQQFARPDVPLFYRRDDTHWTDFAMQAVARHVADYLARR